QANRPIEETTGASSAGDDVVAPSPKQELRQDSFDNRIPAYAATSSLADPALYELQIYGVTNRRNDRIRQELMAALGTGPTPTEAMDGFLATSSPGASLLQFDAPTATSLGELRRELEL
ncbi:MAG TPA: hypothetical protein DDW52_00775, partial [Planctomycetaceae bacterium]|nr:hypothetical protein [Planctomycetaceae bacterium]